MKYCKVCIACVNEYANRSLIDCWQHALPENYRLDKASTGSLYLKKLKPEIGVFFLDWELIGHARISDHDGFLAQFDYDYEGFARTKREKLAELKKAYKVLSKL